MFLLPDNSRILYAPNTDSYQIIMRNCTVGIILRKENLL